MSDPDPLGDPVDIRLTALSRWDNEGGAMAGFAHPNTPDMNNNELVLLRVRVIALENILIAVLAEGSDAQRQTARKMAQIISPRTGATQHELTIRAAQHINDLVNRAVHIKAADLQ